MLPSTKHALAQRAIGAFGLALFACPLWDVPLFRDVPAPASLIGLGAFAFAIVSASGYGPWGRHYSHLVVSEKRQQ